LLFVFIGTFLLGSGIAICNVLLPSLIKEKFPERIALMTGTYTTSMALLATVATATSIPLAVNLNLGWKSTLLVWTIPAFIAIIICLFIIFMDNSSSPRTTNRSNHYNNTHTDKIWTSKLAWNIT